MEHRNCSNSFKIYDGYDGLIYHGSPLPSLRTLRRRLEGISFVSGCLDDEFSLLYSKVNGLSANEKDCCLTLNDIKVTAKIQYDNSSDQCVGNITLPDHSGVADYALMFRLLFLKI